MWSRSHVEPQLGAMRGWWQGWMRLPEPGIKGLSLAVADGEHHPLSLCLIASHLCLAVLAVPLLGGRERRHKEHRGRRR